MKNMLVVLPSGDGDDTDLLFMAPVGMARSEAMMHGLDAIKNATDDDGDRSGEVIDWLEKLGFDCLGDPSVAALPSSITQIVVTIPVYPN